MIHAENISVKNGGFTLEGVNFHVKPTQYCVMMGKTGSGKTTLLEAICGLKEITAGRLTLNGQDATKLGPAARGIGFVPQDGALFTSMSVQDHLSFALQIRRRPKDEIESRVQELSQLLQIPHLLHRRPHQLSGGERQRVALGRALAFKPHILCLDEPLSALDDDTRTDMIDLLRRVQKETGVTALHVTHNRGEAEELADVRVNIVDGRIASSERS